MEIKVLGPGCANCERLEKYVRAAIAELGVEATITKVSQWNDIMAYDVMTTPGLVIDQKVVSSGRVPSKAEITSMITTALMEAE
jgi:small redox-active disulfide protein 2